MKILVALWKQQFIVYTDCIDQHIFCVYNIHIGTVSQALKTKDLDV